MKKFKIPDKIDPEAKAYIKDVLAMLQANGIIEDVDDAAIKMLAYNYSTFIKASKIVEEEGLTITSDRGNIAEHPAVKIGRDAQTSALKVMAEFGLTAKARTRL
ncbi:MAG: phage terminase small subunit P27 family, partial [Bacteroidales bacterium]|nr:phage terminase small subunit P27 family [Bacteroidales bacterium]